MIAKRTIIGGIALIIILVFGIQKYRSVTDEFSTIFLISPEGERRMVSVEIADTNNERSQGLMHRSTLLKGRGMLFLFDAPQELFFWMKNTLIPLEIVYFDENRNFLSQQSMVPCTSEPCLTYPSFGAAMYALEVGIDDPIIDGIGEGWRVDF